MANVALSAFFLSLCLVAPSPSARAAAPPPPSDEEDPIEGPVEANDFYSAFDPQTKRSTTQIVTSNGQSMTIVIDKATNAVYLAKSGGGTTTLSIPDLATAYSRGDPARYAAFMDSMQRNWEATMALETIARPLGHGLEPPNGLASPCDMHPCGVLQRQFIDGRLESVIRWTVEGIDYSYEHWYSPEEIAEDREDFERWRAQQCDDSSSEFTEAFFAYLTAIPSCAVAETGVGLLICGGSLGSGIKDHNDSRTAERNCRRQYPGPRRWGRP
jgi:hypothetical protein